MNVEDRVVGFDPSFRGTMNFHGFSLNLFAEFLLSRRRVCDKDQLQRRRYETMVGTCHAERSRSIYFHRGLFLKFQALASLNRSFPRSLTTDNRPCHGNTTVAELIEIEKV